MIDVDITKERKSLELFIKGLLMDFNNATGLHIEEIEICSAINPVTHKREITSVITKLEAETLKQALF